MLNKVDLECGARTALEQEQVLREIGTKAVSWGNQQSTCNADDAWDWGRSEVDRPRQLTTSRESVVEVAELPGKPFAAAGDNESYDLTRSNAQSRPRAQLAAAWVAAGGNERGWLGVSGSIPPSTSLNAPPACIIIPCHGSHLHHPLLRALPMSSDLIRL